MLGSDDCIAWLTVLMAESAAIVTLNVVTVIVFVKNPRLRRRGMYLVINLAVADALVGGFSGVMHFVQTGAFYCNLWKYNLTFFGLILVGLSQLFPITSIINIAAISLERMHAVYRPFRHRVIQKSTCAFIITVIWVTAALLTTVFVIIAYLFNGPSRIHYYVWCSLNAICLLVIYVAYASILAKTYRGENPQHHGAANRERKLTMTLFIMTFFSLMAYLPYDIFGFLVAINFLPASISWRVNYGLIVLYYTGPLVNPILYACRIPEFKRALALALCQCKTQQPRAVVLPLRHI